VGNWFANLIESIIELPALGWAALAVLALGGVGALLVSRRSKVAATLLAVAAVAGCGILIALTLGGGVELADPDTGWTWLANPWVWGSLFCLVLMGCGIGLMGGVKLSPKELSVCAMLLALGFLLSMLRVWQLPNGGSVTLASMLPIFVIAYLYGVGPGLLAGTAFGLIQIVTGAYVLHPLQFLLDYIIPFSLLGLAGLLRDTPRKWLIGIAIACFARFFCHWLSGVLYWADTLQPPVGWFSAVYNGTYMIPETLLCLVIAALPPVQKFVKQVKAAPQK